MDDADVVQNLFITSSFTTKNLQSGQSGQIIAKKRTLKLLFISKTICFS